MTALLVVGVILAVLLLIGAIPVGGRIRYDESGPLVQVKIGPGYVTVFPRKPKAEKKPKKEKKQKKPKKESKAAPTKKTKPGVSDLIPFLKLAFDFLGTFRRRLTVDELTFHVTYGGKDAADTAIQYGRVCALIGSVMPLLEQNFTIRRSDVQAYYDYDVQKMVLYLQLTLSLRIGRIVRMALGYSVRALKLFIEFKRKKEKTV